MCQQAMSESAMDYEPIKLGYFKALYFNKASDLSDNLQNLQITNFALPSKSLACFTEYNSTCLDCSCCLADSKSLV